LPGVAHGATPPSPIPESEIAAIEDSLQQGARQGRSSVDIRRACKSVIRKAEAILEDSPDAPNKFDLLDVLFQAQQRLLTLEATDDNRGALFETCERLSEAPDKYAESRLEADLLLSERDLGEAEAPVAERVKALEDIMEKYRGTSAELRSLTIAALIAAKLQAFDFHKEIHDTLSSRSFGGDHKAIAFRRRSYSVSRLDVLFGGTYESVDGSSITFPFDRLGHQYLVIFWSLNSDGLEGYEVFLSRIREQQERFPGTFEVYSFNLDGLADAGQSLLKAAGVKGISLHLPEGRAGSVYRAYALMDPMAMFVNAQGHATLRTGQIVPWPRPSPARKNVPANPGPGLGMWLDESSYLGQLRSLFIGDFLVGDQRPATSDQRFASGLKSIQDCFVAPPFRYRLRPKAELDGYREAEKLCAAAIRKHPKAPGLWAVRNCRIIALLGIWKLACESKYLNEAAEEAETTLSMVLPPGKDVVARFCLAKAALRKGDVDHGEILEELVDAMGGEKAGPRALAAAAIAAIEANAPALYEEYRQRSLDLADANDPVLWDVHSFLRDRQHNYRLFWPTPGRWGYTRKQKYQVKCLISGLDVPRERGRIPSVRLADLTGQDVRIPEDLEGKMTGVIFAEPPADAEKREAFAGQLKDYVEQFSKRDVPVVVAFLSEDMNAVKSLAQESGGEFRATVLPGGVSNPLVRQLGILAADRIPNPYLLLGDGTIAWSISGLTYQICGGSTVAGAVSASIRINVDKMRTDRAFEMLDKGDFKKAVSLFDEQLPPKMIADEWTHDRLQGRALARMGLKDWEGALKDIEAAQARLRKASHYGALVHCGSAEMHLAKAAILKKLGRAQDAAEVQETGEKELAWLALPIEKHHPPSYARMGVPVWVYTDLLKRVRLGLEAAEGGK